MVRFGEALLVGAAGAAGGWFAGSLIGLEIPAAVVGGLNGLVCGARRIYDWNRSRGWAAFGLDSTWGLVGTALGLALHAAELVWPEPDYMPELSSRRNRHVYSSGVALRGGFALSLGNVISNAGGRVGLRGESDAVRRRRRFVTAHEELHVWQSRWFGPLFQIVYGAWLLVGSVAGALLWPVVGGRWFNAVETVAYYDNPFEFWAYRNDGYWPPRNIHPKLAWRGGRQRPE